MQEATQQLRLLANCGESPLGPVSSSSLSIPHTETLTDSFYDNILWVRTLEDIAFTSPNNDLLTENLEPTSVDQKAG